MTVNRKNLYHTNSTVMRQYVIYFNTKDFPDRYVCRGWSVVQSVPGLLAGNRNPIPDEEIVMEDKELRHLETVLREMGFYRLPPEPGDDKTIVSVWL